MAKIKHRNIAGNNGKKSSEIGVRIEEISQKLRHEKMKREIVNEYDRCTGHA
jgi:hypothetical protein